MLEQASVEQLRHKEVSKKHGHVAVTMRFYPRGLKKELRDEYIAELAPPRELLADFKKFEKLGHDEAFARSRYVERFALSPGALAHLERLAGMARRRTVYLVCQCAVGQRCHRELLLLLAHRRFGAPIGKVYHSYPGAAVLKG